jgi:class 3 adenylate cyclase
MSILVVDMLGSGRWHNPDQLRARSALAIAVRSAFHAAGIAWSHLVVEDRGDGMIVLVPATVSKVDLLDPVVPALVAAIHRHNADEEPHIRLRVALHAGEVHHDAYGWAGSDLNAACRLVNDTAVYGSLTSHPRSDVVFVVSDVIYDGVVRHGYRSVDPAAYVPVDAAVKEFRARAWVHVPALVTMERLRSVPGR